MGNFGNNLKKLREERNIKVKMLSDSTGISRRTIYAWEKGVTVPASFSSRQLLAKFFHVDPFYFDRENPSVDDPLLKNILIRLEKLEHSQNPKNQKDVHNGHT